MNKNINNNDNSINNNSDNNMKSDSEDNINHLFYKVIHNKYLFQKILDFNNKSFYCQYNCIPLHSLNYLIDNNLINNLRHRVLNNKPLLINTNSDKKKIYKYKKLFRSITPVIKEESFYLSLFSNYLNLYIQYDFDKVIDAIYEADNSIAMSSLYKSMKIIIEQNNLYSVYKIAHKYDQYFSDYHSLNVSKLILKMYYNHKENSESYLNQSIGNKITNNINPSLIYNKVQYGNNKVNISSHSDDKILNQDLIWNSLMNRIGKDKEIQILEQQQQFSVKDKDSNNSSINNHNSLNWPIINKKYYKFINTIVNELNIPPPIQNFKFFSPESWRNLMSTIFCQCPFESNFKVKWLLEACKTINNLKFYNHEKECIEIFKKNGGGILRTNYLLKDNELNDMVFSKYELNQRLNELDLQHSNNNKVIKLLKSYLEVSRLSSIYSKNIHYYCIFGNDDFQKIEFSTTIGPSTNGLAINKYLFLNSFKYAKYELLKEYVLKSNEKESTNYIITTLQEELENFKNKEVFLFKYNNNADKQLQFIKELNDNYHTHKIPPHFIFSLIISTDSFNLINESFELFKDTLKSSNINNNNNNNNNNNYFNYKSITSILNNYKNLLLYTKSSQTVYYLYNLLNNNQNYNIKELLNYQIFYFNGRLDLLALFEQFLLKDNKLKFTSLKEINIKLNSKQFEHYLSACSYVLKRNEIYEINLSALKETVLHSNYCKERYTNSKDVENIKSIIEATKESYKPLELVNHSQGAINLPIISFYLWILKERSNDIKKGRCQLNKAEMRLLEYYTNTLQTQGLNYNQFMSDSKLVMQAISTCGDYITLNNITTQIITPSSKTLDQEIVEKFVEFGDDRILNDFIFGTKFYDSYLVKLAGYNDHINITSKIVKIYIYKKSLTRRLYSNKYSTVDNIRLVQDNCH